MARPSTAFHNYKHELESLEEKFGWFRQERRSVYDLFPGGDILQPVRNDMGVPAYLIERITTIRNWYDEMRDFEDQSGEQAGNIF